MANVLLTYIELSSPPKFFFESFIDNCVLTTVDSLFIDSKLLKRSIFHSYLSEVASSDPGHKKFWKRETGRMFSLRKTIERCAEHMSA